MCSQDAGATDFFLLPFQFLGAPSACGLQGISNEEAEAESRVFALSLAKALDNVKVQDIKLMHVGPCVSPPRLSPLLLTLVCAFSPL